MRAGLFVSIGLMLPVALWAGGPGLARTHSGTSPSRWSAQTSPKPGPARVIGSYSAGCIQGAIPLPQAGPGYEVLHLGRHRYFGHPTLVAYVQRLAATAAKKDLPRLLVGDLSQPRGGPTPTDHGSHQSGLDLDVAYTRPREAMWRPLDPAERESLPFPSVVDLATETLTEDWNARIADLLELAVADPAVDRIFVNPAIKREFCARVPRGTHWLSRLRPWWGHHDHFHVRLKCPEDSTECRSQDPFPSGDGCGEALAWWFTADARSAAEKRRPAEARPPPPQCEPVLR